MPACASVPANVHTCDVHLCICVYVHANAGAGARVGECRGHIYVHADTDGHHSVFVRM